MQDLTEALPQIIRLLVAGALGAVIGYERELRAKGAGIRTHIMVALGAALFMIVSKYGFADSVRFDAARVAAGVVTGIGFIGGGIIMKKKHVSGLTTAASLWVTGAIGLGAGGGMFAVSGVCAAIVIICLEALHFYSFKFGEKEISTVLSSDSMEALSEAISALGKEVTDFSLKRDGSGFKAEISLHTKKRESTKSLMERLLAIPGVRLESLE